MRFYGGEQVGGVSGVKTSLGKGTNHRLHRYHGSQESYHPRLPPL